MEPDHPQEDSKPLQSLPTYLFGKSKLEEKVFCLKARLWWLIFMCLFALLFVLKIGCLGSQKWMSLGSMEGGLLRCADCPEAWNHSSYDEISQFVCDSSSGMGGGLCKVFKSLRDAGAAYVFFELLSLVFLNAWAATVMMLLLNRKCFEKLRWLPYIHPSLAVFFHFLALVIWAGASEAKFNNNCSYSGIPDCIDSYPCGDDLSPKPSVCAEEALALSITVLILYIVIFCLFLLAYCKYRKQVLSDPAKAPDSVNAPAYANKPPEENVPAQGYPGQQPLDYAEQPLGYSRPPGAANPQNPLAGNFAGQPRGYYPGRDVPNQM